MLIRDRIKEFRRVKAQELRPNPRNWRLHPPAQQETLRGILAEIGYASALLARELEDGSLQLIDGHLRAETTPEALVPVLILDLSDAEATKLLLTFDPLSAMAQPDPEALTALLPDVETQCEAVQQLLDQLANLTPKAPEALPAELPVDKVIPELFQVVVECHDEADQQLIFNRMKQEGYQCRLLTL